MTKKNETQQTQQNFIKLNRIDYKPTPPQNENINSIINDSLTKNQISENQNQNENIVSCEGYFMGKNSSIFTRLLYLQYLNIIPAYFKQYKSTYNPKFIDKKFIPYRTQYEPMITNKYLWYRFCNQKEKFNLLRQLFHVEMFPIITMVILSIFVGVLALFGAYFQRYLFTQLHDSSFPISGWVYFGLISGSAILRFFIFNYCQTLANSSAINLRLYLQNSLIKLLFYLPNNISEGLLLHNLFNSVDIIRSSLQMMPYFISSCVIIFGIFGFVVVIIGNIGWIVLGLTFGMLIVEIVLMRSLLNFHFRYVHIGDKRTYLLLLCTENLMNLIQNGLSKIYFNMMHKQRKKQTNRDQIYNIIDGLLQILSQSISFIAIFIFFVLSQNTLRSTGQSQPTYKQILEVVILFYVFKTPIKMLSYGMSMGLEGYIGICRLQELFDLCQNIPELNRQQKFMRVYPLPSPFEKYLHVTKQSFKQKQKQTPKIPRCQFLQNPNYKGKLIMLLGKIDSNPSCQKYLQQLQKNIPSNIKYYKIQSQPLIENKSIRDNILFGQIYNQEKYRQILTILKLKQDLGRFPDGDLRRMDQNYFKTIFVGLQFKIELARALYCNVQLLIINRLIFKQFEYLMRSVKKYRQVQKFTTIIVNLSGYLYQISDWLILLHKNTIIQQGTYQSLKSKQSNLLQQFQQQYTQNKQMIQQTTKQERNVFNISKLENQPIDEIQFRFKDLFRFYNLTHWGGLVVLMLLILAAPLLDLYLEIIIAESTTIWQNNHSTHLSSNTNATDTQIQNQTHTYDHIITIKYGITLLAFFLISLLKIYLFSLYLNISSFKIIQKIVTFIQKSKLQNILTTSLRRNALNIQRNIQIIDTRITIDFDVCMTLIYEHLAAIIFGAVSSTLFLVIGIPFLIITFIIIIIMVVYNRKILAIRRRARSKFNSFLKKLIIYRNTYIKLNKINYIVDQFTQNNRIDIIADLNQQWMLQSLGIILQLVFILLLIITMMVSLLNFDDISTTNAAFIELSISFLIGLTNGGRVNLKIFQYLDFQLVGITSLYKVMEYNEEEDEGEVDGGYNNKFPPYPQPQKQLPLDFIIQTIKFQNFSIKLKDDILHNINVTFRRGDRVVITGSNTNKRALVFALMGIFNQKHIQGDILLNQSIKIYKNKISRDTILNFIYILDIQSSKYLGGKTVLEQLQIGLQGSEQILLLAKLRELWQVLDVQPLFQLETKLEQLSRSQLELLSLVRGLLKKPQILIIERGLNHIDCVNREKITKWLIQSQQIGILLDMTNRIQVMKYYQIRLHMSNGKFM